MGESSLTALDLDAYVDKRLSDPVFVREYIAAHKKEIKSLRDQLRIWENSYDIVRAGAEEARASLSSHPHAPKHGASVR